MAIYKYVSGFIIIVLVTFFSYDYINKKQSLVFIEEQIRSDFKEHLKALPEIDYIDLFGRTPSISLVSLGRSLFNDPIMSRNNDVSCATCHLTNHGFADGNSLSVGSTGHGGPDSKTVGKSWGKGVLSLDRSLDTDELGFQTVNRMFRNTLSTVNVAYRMKKDNSDGLFNDGRFGSVFFQTLMPIHTDLELCGSNPVPSEGNIFEANEMLFRVPVKITHANSYDFFEGREHGEFNAIETIISGVPTFRPNGALSIPGRNECLAITIAKIRSVEAYRDAFEKNFGLSGVTDQNISTALTSFVLTHISNNTPFDKFINGESGALSESQLRGMVSFFTPLSESYKMNDQEIPGGGCFKCHDAPEFGGKGFANLGVRSERGSTLAQVTNGVNPGESFFGRNRLQRGLVPNCHINNVTTRGSYAPDVGRANATFNDEDCFKFRVPPLRNVIETYPYFHHGTARGQGSDEGDFKKRSIVALKQVVKYHLRGPVDPGVASSNTSSKIFYDILEQKDYLIPAISQNFISLDSEDPQHSQILDIFPIIFSEDNLDDLVNFISYGLYDKKSMKRGGLGNDVSHPKNVMSGFTPSITRDRGNQKELPPRQ